VRPAQSDVPWFVSLLVSWLPFIALVGVWIFLARQVQGARGTTQHRADEVDQLKRQSASCRNSSTGEKTRT
jgi:ATP-dependent Zn protease